MFDPPEDNPVQKFSRSVVPNGKRVKDQTFAFDRIFDQNASQGEVYESTTRSLLDSVLDGYNATRELRQDPDPNVNEVLVIAMTASAIEGDREKCISAGMNNYLPKPVRSTILNEMLDQYLAPVPPFTRTRLSIRERSSVSNESGTPGSSSSSGSEPLIALTPNEEKTDDSGTK